jgi:hypothetical protein
MKIMLKQSFIASVKDDYLERMEQVADQLRVKGCEINQILKFSGVITGKVNKQVNLKDLKIEGITSIEKQRVLRKR